MRGKERRGAALRQAALCLLIAGSVGSDCSDDWPVGPSYGLRIGAREVTAIAHVKVPEGTWDISFGCSVTRSQSLGMGEVSRDPFDSIVLHCPRGMCAFDFQLSCEDFDHDNEVELHAQFEFVNDGNGGGCADRDPRFVETRDYHFFQVEFELDHVQVCGAPGSLGDVIPTGDLRSARSVTYIDCSYDAGWGDGDDTDWGDGDEFPDASAEEDAGWDGGSALDGGEDAGSDGGSAPDGGEDAGGADAGDGGTDAP